MGKKIALTRFICRGGVVEEKDDDSDLKRSNIVSALGVITIVCKKTLSLSIDTHTQDSKASKVPKRGCILRWKG